MKTFVILTTLVTYTMAAPYMEQWTHGGQPTWSSRSSDPDFHGPARTLQVNQNAARTNQLINARSQQRDQSELSELREGIQVNLPGAHSKQSLERTAPLPLPESHRNFQKSINIASDAMDNIESGLGANSDSTLHHSIKTAKEALRLVQQGFTNIGDLESSATSADSVQTLKSLNEEKKRMNQWKQTIENIQSKNVVPLIGKSDDAVDIKKDDNAPNTLEQHEQNVEIKNIQMNVTEDQKKIEESVNVDKIQKVDMEKQELDNITNDQLESKIESKPIEKPAVDTESSASDVASVAVDQVNLPSKIMDNVSEKSQQIEGQIPATLKSSEIQSKNSANIPMTPKEDNTEISQKSVNVEEDLQLNARKTENKEPKMAKADQSSKASTTMENWAHHANPMARAIMGPNMRTHNLARSAYGVDSGLPNLDGGLSSGGGSGSAIGLFPHGAHSNCAIPILLSCSPSVVSGSLSKYHNTGYGAPSYRNQELNMRQAIRS